MAGSAHGMAIYEPLLLALLGASGAGRYSLDHLLGRWARRAVRLYPNMPHVVIVGAGFGGMACAGRYAMNRCASR
jgi:NADH dehydrogenase/putative oxidoreductase